MTDETVSLDLDALRAQRAEARGEPKTFRANGTVWTLPDELPLEVGIHMAQGNTLAALEGALGDQWVEFRKGNFSVNDFRALADGMDAIYGVEMGESPASPSSSSSNGSRSRPTSNGSTRSTSRKPSGVRKQTGSR